MRYSKKRQIPYERKKPGSEAAERQRRGSGRQKQKGWKGSSGTEDRCPSCPTRSQAGAQIGKPDADFAAPGGKDPDRLRVQWEKTRTGSREVT